MPRRYRRRRYAIARPLKTAKYSNETYAGNVALQTGTPDVNGSIVIVPKTEILATRKVKNLTLRINVAGMDYIPPGSTSRGYGLTPCSIMFAVVYVPQGTSPATLDRGAVPETGATPAVSLYEPNQNVIMSGIVDLQSVTTVKTRLARNLNSGDQIYVQFSLTYNSEDVEAIRATLLAIANYAISY